MFEQFIKDFEKQVVPLTRAQNLAYFEATLSGSETDYKTSADFEKQVSKVYANRAAFLQLKEFKESGAVRDDLLKRQLDVLYLAFLSKQVDEKKLDEIIVAQNELEKKYATFRTEVNGRKYTDNQIDDILKSNRNSSELRATWLASKQIGASVAPVVLDLARKRNALARDVGFTNYHVMQLQISEQNPDDIEKLFDELEEMTRPAFAAIKDEVDAFLSTRNGVTKSELMPWHYQNRYFQEAPRIYAVDLDSYYQDKDVVELTKRFYAGIGLPIDDMVARSDLFEKEGKYQHAYCIDIDREGDVRVVCNIKPNYSWMNTMLHEFGHAVYDKFQDPCCPWVLREPAHIFTTEAIAMMFGRFASNANWMQEMLGISSQEAARIQAVGFKTLRLEQLVFSRWVQVMYRFEKAMYENPEQDLNKLWWDLVEKYQMLRRPAGRDEPDWAAKIHVALYPAYYHNYMMGELLASQLYAHITGKVLGSAAASGLSNQRAVGKYLIENIFKSGNKYFWNDMIQMATGEKLTPRYFANQFVN